MSDDRGEQVMPVFHDVCTPITLTAGYIYQPGFAI